MSADRNAAGSARKPGRLPWGAILLGAALIAVALLLYFYAARHRPGTVRNSNTVSFGNANR